MTVLVSILFGIGILIGLIVLYLLTVALVPGFSVPTQSLPIASRPSEATHATPPRKEDVSFRVKETTVSAWLYLPRDLSTPVPCIVMGHGLGGTKETGLGRYAARFQEAGFAVFAFDYRHLGESGGEPRQLVWIPYQLEDWSAAIAYVRSLEEIDPASIALWGTSLSGGHVIVTAAKDSAVACVSAQCPLLDGRAGGMQVLKTEGIGRVLQMLRHGQRDIVRSWLGLSPHKIPLVGKPGSVAVMADADAWEAFGELAPEDLINEACARIILRIDKYRPFKHAAKVRCPVLLQVCDDDVSLPRKVVAETERRLGGLAEVVHYPIGHFDIYLGDAFEKAVNDQLAFFKKHLAYVR